MPVHVYNDDTGEFPYTFCTGVKFGLAKCGNEDGLGCVERGR